jgi:hypothetical protein
MLFLLSKKNLCIWISAYPLVEIDDFLKVPHLVWAWDHVDMYLTHLGIRIQKGSFHIYLKKWFFGLQKIDVPLRQGQTSHLGQGPLLVGGGGFMEWARNCSQWQEGVLNSIMANPTCLHVLIGTHKIHNTILLVTILQCQKLSYILISYTKTCHNKSELLSPVAKHAKYV